MSSEYKIPAASAEVELFIKKSTFLGFCYPVANKEEAQNYLNRLREKYPDATHHCSAMAFNAPGTGDFSYMSNDDGEPSGTAGKPILNVLIMNKISDILIVVVRYFGGIKLGAGGLTRAYTKTAADLIKDLPVTVKKEMITLFMQCPYENLGAVQNFLKEQPDCTHTEEFADVVTLKVTIPESDKDQFVKDMEPYRVCFKG